MDERKKILELVASGQLTIDEGDRLIEALDAANAPAAEVVTPAELPGRGVYESIVRAVESATGVGSMRGWLGGPPRRSGRVDEIVSFASNGIDVDYVREMRDAFDDEIDAGEIIAFASNGIEIDYVRDLRDIFHDEIDPGLIVGFASNGIDADYARQMRDIFGDEIDAGLIVGFASNGIDVGYARQMRDIFGDEIDAGMIIGFASNGIDVGYARKMTGLANAPATDVLRHKTDAPDDE